MSIEKRVKGLALKVGPLGENDRLLTLLTFEEGILRIAVPGARRPKSRLAATSALTFLELHIGGKSKLLKARHIKILESFSKFGEKLETLATAQSLTELSMLLVSSNDPQPEILEAILIHFKRLQHAQNSSLVVLANCVQAHVHLLALGGYGLPVQTCCRSREPLIPPIGNWDWSCGFIKNEGFAIEETANSDILLNASELALLQRLLSPSLPLNKEGKILGPLDVWLKFLTLLELWIETHLNRNIKSFEMLKKSLISIENVF